ncbi:MAG TPA: multicopper oxidase domain-containing protein [Thermoanaerobaculia bacterium]
MKKHDSESSTSVTRRRFVATAAAATSAGLLAGSIPFSLRAQTAPCAVETLRAIGEIRSVRGKLKGIIRITNARKNLPTNTGQQKPMMRYLEGVDQQAGTTWPPTGETASLLPGPTLRVGIGERVEITMLNQVRVDAFPGLTLDNAETGATDGCDQASNAPKGKTPDPNWYPGTRGDSFPNCFHASSSANLHFHGTHITPDAFGDNVLVQVRPNPNLSDKDVEPILREVFAQCEQHEGPVTWEHVPASYRDLQAKLVREYDLNAIWKGTRGPVKDPNGKDVPALPLANQLTPANEAEIEEGHWPPYFVGAYPNCFKLPTGEGLEMGQAPGTHWYHAHKHGSTSINLFNGLAGVLLIEGQYDKDLLNLYPDLKQNEKVLIVQQFTDQPNLERPGGKARTKTVNGTQVTAASATVAQAAPTIVMQPGQIQLWRIVNAQVQTTINAAKFTGPKGAAVSPLPLFRQIAQDGVQFNRTNYNDQPLTVRDANGNGTQFDLAPGGRIDILVQAPQLAEGTTSASYELGGIVNLTVCGAALDQQFPDGSKDETYLQFPRFLKDIPKPRRERHLSFDWEPFRLKNGPATQGSTHPASKTMPFPVVVGSGDDAKTIEINVNRGPYWMIDEEQFSDGKYYQTMILGDSEEWTIVNTTSVAHPFHIHVNPFQVVEVFDPNNPTNPAKTYKRETNGVWQDVMLIPGAKTANGLLVIDPETGKSVEKDWGFIRIRSRFVDFAGSFVLHCHILGHEDRGMMQLVRVVPGTTTLKHH